MFVMNTVKVIIILNVLFEWLVNFKSIAQLTLIILSKSYTELANFLERDNNSFH